MPKAVKSKSKPPVVVAPKPPELVPTITPTLTPVDTRPVIYDKFEVIEYSTAVLLGPLTASKWKILLGWETESQYIARKLRENPGSQPAEHMANPAKKDVFGDDYHCREGAYVDNGRLKFSGEKVRCNNNAHNRPFDEGWCEDIALGTILPGRWAGPFTIPGATVNGETVRISRYGEVLSGQHQGTACIWADEVLHKARHDGVDNPLDPRYPIWKKHGEVFIETLVVRGMSDDPKLLMTIDYVKPRTAADVFYTSDVYRACTPIDRRELCRMLSSAVDFTMTRTEAKSYRTHPELVAFLERHKRLLACNEHIFSKNTGVSASLRKIGKLRLQPGVCAAIMFLQASSGPLTSSDDYRNETPAPSEKTHLDWSMYDLAEEFWTLLASDSDFVHVRTALVKLADSAPDAENNQGQGGKAPEKLAILAAAWERWKDHTGDGSVFDDEDLAPDGILCLHYTDVGPPRIKNGETISGDKLPPGELRLIEVADFYGIDCPPKGHSEDSDPLVNYTAEELQAAADAARARRGK